MLSQVTVTLAGLFLVSLGVLALARPAIVREFLLGFATTPARHYTEIAVRVAVGMALVTSAPRMAGPEWVSAGGWILLVTSLAMLLVPWRAHRAFAQRAVPRALDFLPAIGLASIAMGAAILWALHGARAV